MNTSELTKAIRILTSIVRRTVQMHNKLYPQDIRYGGYFCLGQGVWPDPQVLVVIGTIPDNSKAEKYFRVAQKKVKVIRDNPLIISSYQVRDPDNEIWGGGIRAGDKYTGFSGLTEEEDEYVMIRLDIIMGWLTVDEAIEITKISGNDLAKFYFRKFFVKSVNHVKT